MPHSLLNRILQHRGFIYSLTAAATFNLGLLGVVGYSRIFPPTPVFTPPKVLGTTTIPTPPPPTPIPTPDLSLSPEKIDQAYPGTIAFIQDSQIHTLKTDRTLPDVITADPNPKSWLTPSPDGLELAYVFTSETGSGVATVNRKTKKVSSLIEPNSSQYSHLEYSSSGRFLSSWVNQGSDIIIFDLYTGKIASQFTAKDEASGISPVSWIPGTDDMSFIVDSELFTSNAFGQNLKTLALKVTAIKLDSHNQEVPVPPLWSPFGNYLAFVRNTGLYLLNLETREEITLETTDKPFDQDKIPYLPIAFNSQNSHFIYETLPDDQDHTLFAYSLTEKKLVDLDTAGTTNIFSASLNQLIGLSKDGQGQSRLSRYSLTTWKDESCHLSNPPSTFTPKLLSFTGRQFVSLTQNQPGNVNTLQLVSFEDCQAIDLFKTTETLSSPVWLPN